MKNLKRSILIISLIIVLAYVTNITAMPESVIVFKGNDLNLGTIFGVSVTELSRKERTVEVIGSLDSHDTVQTKTMSLSLFNIVPIKEIEVSTIPVTTVIPLGNTVGLRLYTEGVLVVGFGEIEGQKPHLDSGIEEGDMIIKINGHRVSEANELVEVVNKYEGEKVDVIYLREGTELLASIQPARTVSNEYKLGLWVRDGAARNWDSNIL